MAVTVYGEFRAGPTAMSVTLRLLAREDLSALLSNTTPSKAFLAFQKEGCRYPKGSQTVYTAINAEDYTLTRRRCQH